MSIHADAAKLANLHARKRHAREAAQQRPVAGAKGPANALVEAVGDKDLDQRVTDGNRRTGRLVQFVNQERLGGPGEKPRVSRMALVTWEDRQKEAQLIDPALLRLAPPAAPPPLATAPRQNAYGAAVPVAPGGPAPDGPVPTTANATTPGG